MLLATWLMGCASDPGFVGRWRLVTSEEGYDGQEAVVLQYPVDADGESITKAMRVDESVVWFEEERTTRDDGLRSAEDGPYPWQLGEDDVITVAGAADDLTCTVDEESARCIVVFRSTAFPDFVMDQDYVLAVQ